MRRSEAYYCLGGTVIAKNKKAAKEFEKNYYESIGEKYEEEE